MMRLLPPCIAASLLLLASCDLPVVDAGTGTLTVRVQTTGELPDLDGYVVVLNGTERGALGPDGELRVSGLTAGDYALEIGRRSFNCVLAAGTPASVPVQAGRSSEVTVGIHCGRDAVAFIGTRENRYRLFVSVPGRLLLQVADSVYLNPPQWTPDGRKLIFTASRPNTGIRIYIVDPDSARPTELPLTPTGHVIQPHLSPDGTRIAYVARGDFIGSVIRVSRLDGGDARTLLPPEPIDPTVDVSPAWSPDGSWIAVLRAGRPRRLHIVRPDGSELRFLTHARGHSYSRLTWSPDGSAVIYADGPLDSYADADLVSVNSTTGAATPLTSTPDLGELHPALRRDGRIGFSLTTVGWTKSLAPHSIRADGTDLREHPIDFGRDVWFPAWQ